MAAVQRDGFVSTIFETPTRGIFDIPALPLLSGIEDAHPDGVRVQYQRRSFRLSDLHLRLISQVNKNVRVLRGHHLESLLAPIAGVRYDGLYRITQYTLMDVKGAPRGAPIEYVMTLNMSRVSAQLPIAEVERIPTPSDLDLWKLYQEHELRLMRQSLSPEVFTGWACARHAKTREIIERRRKFEADPELTSLWPSWLRRRSVG